MLLFQNIILIIAAFTTALMAGLFFSYSFSVSPGLKQLSDAEYIAAMQSINRAIINPIFFIVFFGSFISLPIAIYLHYTKPVPVQWWLLLIATLIYLFGVLGVTVAGNVPLNNSLEKLNVLHSTEESVKAQRLNFESRWSSLNLVRTISSVIACLCIIVFCIYCTKNK